MKKVNLITVLFTQLIPARIPKVKQADGSFIDGPEIPARTVECSFSAETKKEVTAANVAQFFLGRLVAWQQIRILQAQSGFQTSKPITVSIQVNKKQLVTETKFTINTARIEKCLERNEALVATVTKALNAPEFGAPIAKVKAYLLDAPQHVVLANAKKEDPVEMVEELVEA